MSKNILKLFCFSFLFMFSLESYGQNMTSHDSKNTNGLLIILLSILIYLFLSNWKLIYKKVSLLNIGNKPEEVSIKKSVNTSNLEGIKKIQFELCVVGKLEDAVSLADIILDLDPNDFQVRGRRGSCLLNLNYNLDAIDDLLIVLKYDPNDWNTYGLIGLAYQKTAKYEKSKEFFKKSIDKSKPGIHNNYILNYNIYESMKNVTLKLLEEMNNNPENLKRRTKSDFKPSFPSDYSNELKLAIKAKLGELENQIKNDPSNEYLLTAFKNIRTTYESILKN